MDVTMATQLIGGLGFPIAACVMVFWYLMKEQERNTKNIDSLRKCIEDNTKMLENLKSAIMLMAQAYDRKADVENV